MKRPLKLVMKKITYCVFLCRLTEDLKKSIRNFGPSKFNFLNVGIDLVHIPTFAHLEQASPNFIRRVFADSEVCPQIASRAGIYAAKEATIKSLSRTRIRPDFREIIVDKHDSGFPFVQVEILKNKKLMNEEFVFYASISHHSDYAIAVVLCFKVDPS